MEGDLFSPEANKQGHSMKFSGGFSIGGTDKRTPNMFDIVWCARFTQLFIYFDILIDQMSDYHKRKILSTCFLDRKTMLWTRYIQKGLV